MKIEVDRDNAIVTAMGVTREFPVEWVGEWPPLPRFKEPPLMGFFAQESETEAWPSEAFIEETRLGVWLLGVMLPPNYPYPSPMPAVVRGVVGFWDLIPDEQKSKR